MFVPTSSPSPDFYGGLRPGSNRHANSVVALEAETGHVRWSFQTVHHDVWDYDVPAQPGLYSVWRDGVLHDVVAQATKTGFVFVLDRDTGEPFLPVEERPVPQNGAPGEWLSPDAALPRCAPTHRAEPIVCGRRFRTDPFRSPAMPRPDHGIPRGRPVHAALGTGNAALPLQRRGARTGAAPPTTPRAIC